jgi:isopenicillin-N epimerase
MRGRLGTRTEGVVDRREHVPHLTPDACKSPRGRLATVKPGFLLDPDVAYLNHGGYGACPALVFEENQRLQAELERGPTDFLARRLGGCFWETDGGPGLLDSARAALAAFLGAATNDLVFVPNATSALNAVIRSLSLEPGDEILTTAHEYGAIVRTWESA